jgi:FkbM family methyltransferase
VVLDVGANTGLFALVAGVMDLEVKVHAFEPVLEIYDFWVKNISVNGLWNIQPVKACITSYDGHISVYPDQTPILPFQASTRKRTTRASCPSREVPSRALTLDSYVAEHDIENLGLLKVDVEASDHTVLEGAKRILDRDRPFIVCEVLYTDTEHLIYDLFEGTDYRYFRIVNEGLKPMTEVLGDSEHM